MTFRIPTPALAILFALLAFYQPSVGQPASSTTRSQTFHVHGTITDSSGGVILGTTVSFQSELLTKESVTNDSGAYEVDLPLGVYTMTARAKDRGFAVFHRPPFRVSKPASITVDATLVVTSSDGPLEESFVIPSDDHVPFQLYIRKKRNPNDSIFVAYNLFSLQADNVAYSATLHVLDAQGHVTYVNESGQSQRADALAFRIEGGQAVRLP